MKKISVAVCLMVMGLLGGNGLAQDKEELLPVFQKMVAEDKARFGIDVKKCRHECERVYSKDHCVAKCREISEELRRETFTREAEEKIRIEEEKPLKYKEVAEKYK